MLFPAPEGDEIIINLLFFSIFIKFFYMLSVCLENTCLFKELLKK